MKKINKKYLFIFIVMTSTLPAYAGNVEITSNYPAPFGTYDRIHLVPRADLTGPCQIGDLYVDGSNNFQFCNDNGTGQGVWGHLREIWSEQIVGNNRNVYPTDTLVNPNLKVGIRTTTPQMTLTLDNDGGILAEGTFQAGDTLTSAGAGAKFIWYPRKAAFRAGSVTGTQWNDANIGEHSVAMGYNNIASGAFATALGTNSTASGLLASTALQGTANIDYATAIGLQSTASGNSATAMGYLATAAGNQSTAIGDHASAPQTSATALGGQAAANGPYATALGSTTASGTASTSMGNGTTASGTHSLATGYQTLAQGNYSFAAGNLSQATLAGAVALGWTAHATGTYAFSAGYNTTASGNSSVAIGNTTLASSPYSVALGNLSQATSNNSVSLGDTSLATPYLLQNLGASVAIGHLATALQTNYAVALGDNARVQINGGFGHYSTAIGRNAQTRNSWATSIGQGALSTGIYATAIGNAPQATNSFATAIGNGPIASNIGAVAIADTGTASGQYSVIIGLNNTASGQYAAAIGTRATAAGLSSMAIGQNVTVTATANYSVLFGLGNGGVNRSLAQANTLAIMDGRVGIGTVAPAVANFLEVIEGAYGLAAKTGGGFWTFPSDRRLKKNIQPLPDRSLEKFLQLRGVNFEWKNPEEHGNLKGVQMGFIAQDVEKIFPEWIKENSEGYKILYLDGYHGLMVKSFQELDQQIQNLTKEYAKVIQEQNNLLAQQEKEINKLEKKVNPEHGRRVKGLK